MPNQKKPCEACGLQRWTTEFAEQHGASETCMYCFIDKKHSDKCSSLYGTIDTLKLEVKTLKETIDGLLKKGVLQGEPAGAGSVSAAATAATSQKKKKRRKKKKTTVQVPPNGQSRNGVWNMVDN